MLEKVQCSQYSDSEHDRCRKTITVCGGFLLDGQNGALDEDGRAWCRYHKKTRSTSPRPKTKRLRPDFAVLESGELVAFHRYYHHPEWKKRRLAAIRAAGGLCVVCGRPEGALSLGLSLQVHHRTYERYGHESLEDLQVVHAECHRIGHEYAWTSNGDEAGVVPVAQKHLEEIDKAEFFSQRVLLSQYVRSRFSDADAVAQIDDVVHNLIVGGMSPSEVLKMLWTWDEEVAKRAFRSGFELGLDH